MARPWVRRAAVTRVAPMDKSRPGVRLRGLLARPGRDRSGVDLDAMLDLVYGADRAEAVRRAVDGRAPEAITDLAQLRSIIRSVDRQDHPTLMNIELGPDD